MRDVAKVRTLVASNHKTFRCDLTRCVQLLDPCVDVVREVATAGEALVAISELRPDLILLELSLRPGNALQLVKHIHRLSPATAVVVIGNEPAAFYRDAVIAAGALDYVDVLELTTALPAALQLVESLAACQERSRQSAEPVMAVARPSRLAHPMPAGQRRALLAKLRKRLRTAPTGPKHGPFTMWQYVHLCLALVLLQVFESLQHAPDAQVTLPLMVLLCLVGVAALETRQFARARRAAQAIQ